MCPADDTQLDPILNRRLDAELDESRAEAIDRRLSESSELRKRYAELEALDRELTTAFSSVRERGAEISARSIERIRREPRLGGTMGSSSMRWLARTALALAAGFLIATWIYRPWQRPEPTPPNLTNSERETSDDADVSGNRTDVDAPTPKQPDIESPSTTKNHQPIATLARVDGSVLWLAKKEMPIEAPGSTFFGGEFIGTDSRSSAEFGCGEWRLRAAPASAWQFDADHSVRLVAGQLAFSCAASKLKVKSEPELVVFAGNVDVRANHGDVLVSIENRMSKRPRGKELDPDVQVLVDAGRAYVVVADERIRIGDGQRCSIAFGERSPVVDDRDGYLLATRWQRPLMSGSEIDRRASRLIAGLDAALEPGVGKQSPNVAERYERQLRELGGGAVSTLIAYVDAKTAVARKGGPGEDVARALGLIADLADAKSTERLIALLESPYAEARVRAATALGRVTGHRFGGPPEMWREPPSAKRDVLFKSALERWHAWQDAER